MSRLSGLFLFSFTLCLLHQSAEAKSFVLTGKIQCGLGGHKGGFVKSIEVVEAIPKRNKVGDNGLKQHVTLDTKASPVTYKIEGSARDNYSPFFRLKHNCTPGNQETIQHIQLHGEGTDKNGVYYQEQNLNAKKGKSPKRKRQTKKMNPKIIAKGDEDKKCPCPHKMCSYDCTK